MKVKSKLLVEKVQRLHEQLLHEAVLLESSLILEAIEDADIEKMEQLTDAMEKIFGMYSSKLPALSQKLKAIKNVMYKISMEDDEVKAAKFITIITEYLHQLNSCFGYVTRDLMGVLETKLHADSSDESINKLLENKPKVAAGIAKKIADSMFEGGSFMSKLHFTSNVKQGFSKAEAIDIAGSLMNLNYGELDQLLTRAVRILSNFKETEKKLFNVTKNPLLKQIGSFFTSPGKTGSFGVVGT